MTYAISTPKGFYPVKSFKNRRRPMKTSWQMKWEARLKKVEAIVNEIAKEHS